MPTCLLIPPANHGSLANPFLSFFPSWSKIWRLKGVGSLKNKEVDTVFQFPMIWTPSTSGGVEGSENDWEVVKRFQNGLPSRKWWRHTFPSGSFTVKFWEVLQRHLCNGRLSILNCSCFIRNGNDGNMNPTTLGFLMYGWIHDAYQVNRWPSYMGSGMF